MHTDVEIPIFQIEQTSINRTEAAFVAREIDSYLAQRLRKEGWTLGKIQQQDDNQLSALGISPESIALIRSSGRPDVPIKNLIQVLVANRFTCCVCRKKDSAIVVHHIKSWAISQDHSVDNLAVLCPEDHVKAHSRSDIARNLDEGMVAAFKSDWENLLKSEDAQAILASSISEYAAWWYFNHKRLFELARSVGVDGESEDKINKILATNESNLCCYLGPDVGSAYSFTREILHRVIDLISIRNISDKLDASYLAAVLRPGDFVFVQGAHFFKRNSKKTEGPGQTCTGRRQANRVVVRFHYDQWETTSVSAHSFVSGCRRAGSIVRIVELKREGGLFVIDGSVLAVSAPFHGLRNRDYGGFPSARFVHDQFTNDD